MFRGTDFKGESYKGRNSGGPVAAKNQPGTGGAVDWPCVGAVNPLGSMNCWLNALLASLARLPACTELLSLVDPNIEDPVVMETKRVTDDIGHGRVANTTLLLRAMANAAPPIIASHSEPQDPSQVFESFLAHLDRHSGQAFTPLFRRGVAYIKACSQCGQVHQGHAYETPTFWVCEETLQPSDGITSRPSSQVAHPSHPDHSKTLVPVNDYYRPHGEPLTSAQLYRANFTRPSQPAFCSSCGVITFHIDKTIGLRHGDILVLKMVDYADAPRTELHFLGHFSDPTDASNPWRLSSLVLYHGPKEKNGHYSTIVNHNGWKRVSDDSVTAAVQSITNHRENGRVKARVSLAFYAKRILDSDHNPPPIKRESKKIGKARAVMVPTGKPRPKPAPTSSHSMPTRSAKGYGGSAAAGLTIQVVGEKGTVERDADSELTSLGDDSDQ